MTAARVLPALLLAALAVTGCSSSDPPAPKPVCTHAVKVELARVDDGAPYMAKMFKTAGGEDSGPVDPGAREAKVSAGLDVWMHEPTTADGLPRGSRRFSDYYLTSPSRAWLEDYLATQEAVPSDRRIVLQRVTPPGDPPRTPVSWRTYYVVTPAILDDSVFANAQFQIDQLTSHPMVRITLTPAGTATFAAATTQHAGHKLATIVDGIVLSAPIVNGAITGGKFTITVDTQEQAHALVDKLSCPST